MERDYSWDCNRADIINILKVLAFCLVLASCTTSTGGENTDDTTSEGAASPEIKNYKFPEWLPPVADKYWQHFVDAGREFDIDPRIALCVACVESGFHSKAESSEEAKGLMQLMPGTAGDLAGALGLEDYDVFDPGTNIRMGTLYIRQQLDAFGTKKKAVMAYYIGPNNLKNERKILEGKDYRDWVIGMYEESELPESDVFNRWVSAIINGGGYELKKAFEEQGINFEEYVSSITGITVAGEKSNGEVANNQNPADLNCRAIKADKEKIIKKFGSGGTLEGLPVDSGEKAVDVWKELGKPVQVEACFSP